MKLIKTLVFVSTFSILSIVSCTPKASDSTDDNKNDSTVVVEKLAHNDAMNKLDWKGTYQGIVPDSANVALDYTLTLNNDTTFSQTVYNKDTKTTINTSGRYYWENDADIIVLIPTNSNDTIKVFVTNNELTLLSKDDKMPDGELGEYYVLEKTEPTNGKK